MVFASLRVSRTWMVLLVALTLSLAFAFPLLRANPQDVPPTALEGRAEFGAANYLGGELQFGAHGHSLGEANLLRNQNVSNFRIQTTANEVLLGFPLHCELSPDYDYEFVLKVFGVSNSIQWKYPYKILLNNEVIWERSSIEPLDSDPDNWDEMIDNITYQSPSTNTNGGDDIIWVIVQSPEAPQGNPPTLVDFPLMHVRPPWIVEYYRGSSNSGTRPTYATVTLPSSPHATAPVFLTTADSDALQPSVASFDVVNSASPVWPIIGSELREHQLDDDVFDYLVDRGINMIYLQDNSYANELDVTSHPLRTAFEDLTDQNSTTGESRIKLVLTKAKTLRRPTAYNYDAQKDLITDLANRIADSHATTKFVYLSPEITGAEMTRFLNKLQYAAPDPNDPNDDWGEVGDWANLNDSTTEVFKEAGEIYPYPGMFTYLSEWSDAMEAFNDDLLDNITGLTMGVAPSTQMATFPAEWVYDSLPADTAGGPPSYYQVKTLLRQNVNLVNAVARGYSRAFDRLMATRLDPWAGERSTWHIPQMERAFRSFYYHGADIIDHEGGEAITKDGSGNVQPNARGTALFKVAKFIREHSPLPEVVAAIALVNGRGNILGRHSIYDWEQLGNHIHAAIDPYAADLDLLNVFFTEYGDRYQSNIDRLFTGAPFGPVDIIPSYEPAGHDGFYQAYPLIAVIGLNQMPVGQSDDFIDYVNSGGTLVIAAGQLMNQNERGERKITTGGADLLTEFDAAILLSGPNPVTLPSSVTDLLNYELIPGTSGEVLENWTNKSSASTSYPKAVSYPGDNGGKLILLSGEVLMDTGAHTVCEQAVPTATYAGTLLSSLAQAVAPVLTVSTETDSDFFEPVVLQDADAVTLALFNHANFRESDFSHNVDYFTGTLKIRRDLFPGLDFDDLTPNYTYPSNLTGPVEITESGSDHYALSVNIWEWAEIRISKTANLLLNASFESGTTNWAPWSSGSAVPAVATDVVTHGTQAIKIDPASGTFSASLQQTVSDLPAGDYEVSALYQTGGAGTHWDKARVELWVDNVLEKSADLTAGMTEWTESTQSLNLPGTADLKIKLWFKDLNGTVIRLDRLSLKPID